MDFISLLGTASGLFSAITGMIMGKEVSRILDIASNSGDRIETLANDTFYIPSKKIIKPAGIFKGNLEIINNPTQLISLVQSNTNSPVVSGEVLETRSILTKEIHNPRDFLVKNQKLYEVFKAPEEDMAGVFYLDNGVPYIGWQKKVLLPALLGISYNPDKWLKSSEKIDSSKNHKTIFLPPKESDPSNLKKEKKTNSSYFKISKELSDNYKEKIIQEKRIREEFNRRKKIEDGRLKREFEKNKRLEEERTRRQLEKNKILEKKRISKQKKRQKVDYNQYQRKTSWVNNNYYTENEAGCITSVLFLIIVFIVAPISFLILFNYLETL